MNCTKCHEMLCICPKLTKPKMNCKCGNPKESHKPYCNKCLDKRNLSYYWSEGQVERRARIKAQIEARKLELKTKL